MSELQLYGLRNCDACKTALTALESAGHTVKFVDIRLDADLAAQVPKWLAASGAAALVNKRSTTWRGLSETDKVTGEGHDIEAIAALLVAHPTLIKRPVIERGAAVLIGWGAKVRAELGETG